MSQHRACGITLILAAAVLWGTTGTTQSFAPLNLSSYWIGAARLLIAGVFFLLWLGITDAHAFRWSRARALPWRLILAAALCMTIYNLAFFAGLRATSVAIGTAIALGSGPVWAGLLQVMTSRQLPTRDWWQAVTIAVVGLIIATLAGADDSTTLPVAGMALCLLSGLAYALYALTTKHIVARASASVTTAAVFVSAAALALPGAWVLAGAPQVLPGNLAVLLWLGVIATGVAYLLFSLGLRFVSSATGVALALAEPVAAVALAILIVGERPGAVALAGLILLLLGLGLLVRAEMRVPAASTHPS